jgi:DNA-binding transcriptional LysR family regulator
LSPPLLVIDADVRLTIDKRLINIFDLLICFFILIKMSTTQKNPTDRYRQLRLKSQQIMLLSALDEHRNLRRAAAAIHTTQPAATASLQQLEERLGVELFERHPRGMIPTKYGEAMIRYARGVLHDFEHATLEIAALASGAAGVLRIGSVMGAVPTILTDTLTKFQASNPNVCITIVVETSDLLVPAIIRGELDIVLGRLPDSIYSSNLFIEPLEGEPMSVIGRPDHPMMVAGSLSIGNLLNYCWILHPDGSPMRRRIEQAFQAAGITSIPDMIETASILATTALLAKTDALSVVPARVAEHYAGYGMIGVLPVDLPIAMANLGIITRSDRSPSPALTVFVDTLKMHSEIRTAESNALSEQDLKTTAKRIPKSCSSTA